MNSPVSWSPTSMPEIGTVRAQYEGVGVGTAAVAGPVARMGQTPPEPPDSPATGSPDDERATAFAALAAVAAD
ncbi:MAG: hypothetical protein HOV87_13140, partial [Catenulispora sp.]|nr:hypothetical protein [Catenulispora sp.]